MVPDIDRRRLGVNRVVEARRDELEARAQSVSDALPGSHRVQIDSFDPLTGNAKSVASSGAPAIQGDYVSRALNHVQSIAQVLGLEETQPAEFAADPNMLWTTSGAVTVHLQQQYKGIPIFQAKETVRFAPDGALKETVGSSVTVGEDHDARPGLTAQDAVMKSAQHVAQPPTPDAPPEVDEFGQPMEAARVDLAGFVPRVVSAFPDKPDRLTVMESGPFAAPIRTSLWWFPLDDGLHLAWEVVLTMPGMSEQYRTMIDARDGEVLYCLQLVQSVAAQGNVYRVNGGTGRQMTPFPRALADYELPIPADLPNGFPDDWVGLHSTEGNCVFARLGDFGGAVRGDGEAATLTFDPADAVGDDQKVLNIFYFNCVMHDFFYLLGFREADGCFQQDNLGRGGLAVDRVDARSHPGPVNGTANMITPPDGSAPTMNMGLVASTGRHTAFDSSVVFHEFMHGVTNRLVGGPNDFGSLAQPQSRGMGEGWGDYIACTINGVTVVGDWVTGNPGGIRAFPYDASFPDDFGNLGSGRYAATVLPGGTIRIPVHNIGEIWCATLIEMNRNIGKVLGVQLVVDALKLSPANPSFLDMRDAILLALDNKRDAGQISPAAHATARTGVGAAFSRFGMGPGASSVGAGLSGIVSDFNAFT